MSWLSLSSNSGSVEMCLGCLYLVTLEVWKCGNISSLTLSNNSGSVEKWKCRNVCWLSLCSISGSVEIWKCGKQEMCLGWSVGGGGYLG